MRSRRCRPAISFLRVTLGPVSLGPQPGCSSVCVSSVRLLLACSVSAGAMSDAPRNALPPPSPWGGGRGGGGGGGFPPLQSKAARSLPGVYEPIQSPI